MEFLSFDEVKLTWCQLPAVQSQAAAGLVQSLAKLILLDVNQPGPLNPWRNCRRDQTAGQRDPFPRRDRRRGPQTHAAEHRDSCEPADSERTQRDVFATGGQKQIGGRDYRK